MDATSVRGAWKEVVELGVCLEKAIRTAVRRGSITPLDCAVLYLCYWHGYSDQEIAAEFRLSADAVWRRRKKALRALRDTGVLIGYEANERCPEQVGQRKTW